MSEIDPSTPRTPIRPSAPTHPGQAHQFSSGDASVTITVPPNSNAIPAADHLHTIPGVGRGRRVMNLKMRDSAGNPVTNFSPPFELRVRAVGAEANVQVHFNGQWQDIPDDWVPNKASKFNKRAAHGPAGQNDVVVLLSYWPPDPGIGIY